MSKKQKTSTKPSKFAMPYISGAAAGLQDSVAANAPNLQAISGTLAGGLPDLAAKAFGSDPLMGQAKGYAGDVLGGKYLTGNPNLEGMIERTRGDVSDQINSIFSRAGRTGSGRHAQDLTRGLADAELGMRYSDYDRERGAMERAAGMAPGLYAGQFAGVSPLLGLAGAAAETPYVGSRLLAQGMGGLLGGYNTQTQSPGLGSSLMGLAGAGLSSWATGGFK